MSLSDLMCLHFYISSHSVSILVLMDVSFRQEIRELPVTIVVSILVLMDVSFRQEPKRGDEMKEGFHPCFNG